MKKILALSIAVFFLCACDTNHEIFRLEDKYYNNSNVMTISADEYNDLIENKESFLLFIYQPLCASSNDFEQVLNEFLEEEQVSFYKLAFSSMKETDLYHDIKYYPSFAVFHEGELIGALDANSDDDTKYYKSVEEFKNWLTSYVSLDETLVE